MDPTEIRLLSAPIILGIHLNWGLEGILLVQTYIYNARYTSDPLRFKVLVYGVFVYETVQACLLVGDIFHYWVYNYGDPDVLVMLSNMWFSIFVMGGIMAAVVQSFYAWRIWKIEQHLLMTVPIVIISFAQLALAITSGVKTKLLQSVVLEHRIAAFIEAWLACALLANFIVSITMTVHLLKSGRTTGSTPISRALAFLVESGALLAIFTLAELVLYIVELETNMHLLFALVSSKIYANSLLMSFNNRALPGMNTKGFFSPFHTSNTRLGTASTGTQMIFAQAQGTAALGIRSMSVKETFD
ncbi:uncharacterized protein B0H18DRAFT_1117711 [Fomitopsis serialis]|uniref:uncharacterized protein n=1 Tax=Fomitopsis serialis TaxID=139415 RepID=UPI00200766AE|nr:uncharacterized protein B0H18DRAFT_1117711 [Neoantrodia serialis]KAH9928892.1 hypothetical protein B0H18DRAFT_1117711 [Neoantrodia serialis]